MKRRTASIAIGLAIAMAGLVLVGATVATPSTTPSKVKTFKYAFRFSDAHTRLDHGAGGSTTGDAETFSGPIVDASNNKRIGFGHGQCVVTLPNRPLAHCSTTLFFQHGQISTQGPNYFNRPFNQGIIGGTGVFRGAHGEVRVAPFANSEGWDMKLQVVR